MKRFLSLLLLCLFSNSVYSSTFENNEILSDGDIKKTTALGTIEDLQTLLNNKIDINKDYGCTSLLNTTIQSILFSNNPQETINKIKLLIDAGANVNLEICKMTPLAVAVSLPSQQAHLKQQYLSQKINCHDSSKASCPDLTTQEKRLLFNDIQKNFDDQQKKLEPYFITIIDILLQAGADINQSSYHLPIIFMAAQSVLAGNSDILKHLIDKGADINVKYEGTSLFDFAKKQNNYKAINILTGDIKHSANNI